jgi:hypothetical protein
MKTRLLFLAALTASCFCNAQTVFWTEAFSNACPAGCTVYSGPNGAWNMNVSTGANNASCNLFYVSCADDGLAAGGCGSACVTSDPSLHMGSQSMGDMGAAYDAAQTTNRRTESPNINTAPAGANQITMRFNFIHFGDAGTDRCQLLYSINGGTTWLLLENPIPKAPCCGGPCDGQVQGQWTARSYLLPITCNNIANFRIAFNWINNASGGTDPSFAVDDITLEYTAPLPVTWLSFEGSREGNQVSLKWATATECNNDFFEVQRSFNGISFSPIGKVKGSGNSNRVLSYHFVDAKLKSGIAYYRLMQVDYNGASLYSDLIAVSHDAQNEQMLVIQNTLVSTSLSSSIFLDKQGEYSIEISDAEGKIVSKQPMKLNVGLNNIELNTAALGSGVYYLFLKNNEGAMVIAGNKFVKM